MGTRALGYCVLGLAQLAQGDLFFLLSRQLRAPGTRQMLQLRHLCSTRGNATCRAAQASLLSPFVTALGSCRFLLLLSALAQSGRRGSSPAPMLRSLRTERVLAELGSVEGSF